MAFGEALGPAMGLPPSPTRPRKKTNGPDKEGAKGAAAIKVGAVPKEGKSFEGLGPSEKLVMAAKPDNTNQQAKLGVYPSNQMQPTRTRTQVVPIPIPIDPSMMGGGMGMDPSMGGGLPPPPQMTAPPPMPPAGPPMSSPQMGPSGMPPPGIGPSAGMMPPPGPPPPMGGPPGMGAPPMGGPPMGPNPMMRRRPGMM